MGWADWMVVNQTLEEELELERTVRDVKSCADEDALKALCVSLVRTNWHQAKLPKQQLVTSVSLMSRCLLKLHNSGTTS